jgi:hypothetical protein
MIPASGPAVKPKKNLKNAWGGSTGADDILNPRAKETTA